jgi:hypothetical protein
LRRPARAPVAHWAEVIADPVIADAIRDRLEHVALVIKITGESYRAIAPSKRQSQEARPEKKGGRVKLSSSPVPVGPQARRPRGGPSLGHARLQSGGRLGRRPFGPWPVDYGDGPMILANTQGDV